MPDFVEKEKASGIWNGMNVRFNREWRGHRFTDEEVDKLLDGEEIAVAGLVSQRTGATYGVRGKLTEQEYNGHTFVGFEQTGFLGDALPQKEKAEGLWHSPDGDVDVRFNREFSGHRFTDDEVTLLLAGKTIAIDDFVSKKTGKTYGAKGCLQNLEYNGHPYVGFKVTDWL